MIGALIGDIEGSVYEFNNIKTKEFDLFNKDCYYTDDSVMTLAVGEMMQNKEKINKDYIIDTFKKWGRAYPNAGYGGHFYWWLKGDSREAYNSCGNGSAMRISPCGWYGKNEDEVIDYSKQITEVTHNHPEGLKGAVITALCIYYARTGKTKEYIKDFVSNYYNIDFNYEELKASYEHLDEICQITVPQALFCFFNSYSLEDCIRTTISIGGDCDTTSAISVAVAEAYYKEIDPKLYNFIYNKLPRAKNNCNAKEIVDKFITDKKKILTNI